MKQIPGELKQAIYWFVDALTKGQLESEHWNFEPTVQFDSNELDWDEYIAVSTDPTIAKTAYTIWMNNIRLDDENHVHNETHASFRAFQYLRSHFDRNYNHHDIQPPLTLEELEEAQF